MLENLRMKIAQSLYPRKAREINLSSFAMPGQPIYSDMTVRKATREGYKLSLYVYRAVRTIVEAGSGIPWVVLDKDGEQILNHPFELVMKRPNPYQSGQDIMEFLIAHRKLCGNALWMPMYARGIKEIWMVMPDLVKPIPSVIPGEWLSGWQVEEAGGKQKIMPPETFIHFMQFDPGNPYWGVGDLQAAARTVDTDNEAQDTQKVSMQNRGIPSGIFQHSEPLSPEQFEEQNRRVREIFLEKTKRREPWVLGAGASWQPMSLSPVELDFLMSRRDAKRDIAGAFNVDPWFLGDRENSTYNNVAEARKGLYENNIIPMLDDVKATMNLVIAPMYPGDITISYDTSNIAALREDFGKKVTQAQSLWAMGVPFNQINDTLELGFQEFPGWDSGYLPFSVMPTGVSGDTEVISPQVEPLNGIQVTAIQEVIRNLIDGLLPPTVALELLVGVGIDRARAQAMITAAVAFTPTVPQAEVIEGLPVKKKFTEEQKTVYWKRIDARRQAYWPLIQKKALTLYKVEGEAVARAIDSKALKFSIDELERLASNAIGAQKQKWLDMIAAVGKAILWDFGAQVASDIGFTFNPTTPAVKQWLKDHATANVTSILDTNLADVKRIIIQGTEDNIGNSAIARQLRQFYDEGAASKAMRVARTETAQAAGYGQHESARQSGVMNTHTWLSSRDDRVRDSHLDVDGEEQPLNEPYSNGLAYPGDPSGDAEDVINCRCAEQFGT